MFTELLHIVTSILSLFIASGEHHKFEFSMLSPSNRVSAERYGI